MEKATHLFTELGDKPKGHFIHEWFSLVQLRSQPVTDATASEARTVLADVKRLTSELGDLTREIESLRARNKDIQAKVKIAEEQAK